MKAHLFSSIPLRVIIPTGLMVFTACQEPEKPEPYPDSDLVLEKLDVSCTEAWLKVSLSGADSSAATAIPVILTRDGEAIQSFAFTPPETLVVDAGLDPSHSYQYQVQRQSVHDNKVIDTSNTLTVTTLDTTSHDFTWTIDTLGNYGSYFNDVAIIDENNIWAVGNIETDSGRYNLAKWDGNSWHMDNVGPVGNNLYSIFAFSEDDVWVANACSPFHWDGNEWSYYRFSSGGVGVDACAGNAIWGSSPEDVWFVGNGGSIVHYDGVHFDAIDTGTFINLQDIDGTPDGSQVFAAGYTQTGDHGGQSVALRYINGRWETVYSETTVFPSNSNDWGLITSVWYNQGYAYYMSYSGLRRLNIETGETDRWFSAYQMQANDLHINNISGPDINDIIMLDNWGGIVHYNGIHWQKIMDVFNHFNPGNLDMNGMDRSGNLMVGVGTIDPGWRAAVIRIRL